MYLALSIAHSSPVRAHLDHYNSPKSTLYADIRAQYSEREPSAARRIPYRRDQRVLMTRRRSSCT